jgi:acetyltransferase-like isoleucine patch superfamily enzyme
MIIKFIRAVTLFFLPSFLSIFFLRLFGCKVRGKVGFSWVWTDKIVLDKSTRIGHFNLITVSELNMKEGSFIRRYNIIKGGISVFLNKKSIINQFNKLTAGKSCNSRFVLNYNSIIGSKHLLELTSNIIVGDHSIFAGEGSQVWTHGFYHSKFPLKRWRVDGDVVIGKNVYIGARCILNAGVTICDNATIGSGSVVSKDISVAGLYVNQPLRLIEFDPDVKILKYIKINDNVYKKK